MEWFRHFRYENIFNKFSLTSKIRSSWCILVESKKFCEWWSFLLFMIELSISVSIVVLPVFNIVTFPVSLLMLQLFQFSHHLSLFWLRKSTDAFMILVTERCLYGFNQQQEWNLLHYVRILSSEHLQSPNQVLNSSVLIDE